VHYFDIYVKNFLNASLYYSNVPIEIIDEEAISIAPSGGDNQIMTKKASLTILTTISFCDS